MSRPFAEEAKSGSSDAIRREAQMVKNLLARGRRSEALYTNDRTLVARPAMQSAPVRRDDCVATGALLFRSRSPEQNTREQIERLQTPFPCSAVLIRIESH